jgi:hypothetical protein
VTSVIVDGRPAMHQRIDIRNRDEHPDRASGSRLGNRQLIEIARVVVIYRAPQKVAQISDFACK